MVGLKKQDCLFLMIDMQPSLFGAMIESEALLTNCKLLLETRNVLDIPLIVTTQYSGKLGSTIDALAERFPAGQPVFDKVYFDALGDDRVKQAVLASGRKTIVLFGMETHVCVFQTAVHCLAEGLSVIAVSDAVSSRTLANKNTGLQAVQNAGGRVLSTEMVVYGIMEKAGTPEFKKMLPWFKDPAAMK